MPLRFGRPDSWSAGSAALARLRAETLDRTPGAHRAKRRALQLAFDRMCLESRNRRGRAAHRQRWWLGDKNLEVPTGGVRSGNPDRVPTADNGPIRDVTRAVGGSGERPLLRTNAIRADTRRHRSGETLNLGASQVRFLYGPWLDCDLDAQLSGTSRDPWAPTLELTVEGPSPSRPIAGKLASKPRHRRADGSCLPCGRRGRRFVADPGQEGLAVGVDDAAGDLAAENRATGGGDPGRAVDAEREQSSDGTYAAGRAKTTPSSFLGRDATSPIGSPSGPAPDLICRRAVSSAGRAGDCGPREVWSRRRPGS